MGFYPSTEGLLHLITTLVSVGGCPSDLGRFRRARSGCAPYIEFVIHFVLPRAMGTHQHDGGLPFRTLADKSRLVSLALEVVEAVLLRYVVPPANGSLATQSPTDSSNATMVAVQTVRDLLALRQLPTTFLFVPMMPTTMVLPPTFVTMQSVLSIQVMLMPVYTGQMPHC